MKIGLASCEYITGNIIHNISVINDCSKKHKIDMLLFGESFLHGFDGLTWDSENDFKIALEKDSSEINFIKKIATQNHIILGVGYFEKFDGKIYDSYILIDQFGKEIINYRRVSEGWKINKADKKIYAEGNEFPIFKINDQNFSIGLCGDFWHDDNIKKMKSITKDFVIWPLYINYSKETWENEKYEYSKKANLIGENVLLINSINKLPYECFGGAIYFKNGIITKELKMGVNDVLIIEI